MRQLVILTALCILFLLLLLLLLLEAISIVRHHLWVVVGIIYSLWCLVHLALKLWCDPMVKMEVTFLTQLD